MRIDRKNINAWLLAKRANGQRRYDYFCEMIEHNGRTEEEKIVAYDQINRKLILDPPEQISESYVRSIIYFTLKAGWNVMPKKKDFIANSVSYFPIKVEEDERTETDILIERASDHIIAYLRDKAPWKTAIYKEHFVHGLKPKEIAEKYDINESSIRTRIRRLKKEIKFEIENKFAKYINKDA